MSELIKRAIDRGDSVTVEGADAALTEAFGYLELDRERWGPLIEDLDRLTATHRFGLAMWSLYRLFERRTNEAAQIFLWFQRRFGNVSLIEPATTAAIGDWAEGRMPWSRWVSDEYPTGRMHGVDIDHRILRTFVYLLALATDAERAVIRQEWIHDRVQQVREIVQELKGTRSSGALFRLRKTSNREFAIWRI